MVQSEILSKFGNFQKLMMQKGYTLNKKKTFDVETVLLRHLNAHLFGIVPVMFIQILYNEKDRWLELQNFVPKFDSIWKKRNW